MYQDGGSFSEGYAIGRDTNRGGYGYGGGFGGDWWGLIALALVFGWGGNGFGGGFGGGGGSELLGYQLGQTATTKDVASGFSTSEIMSDLNAIQLTQANNLNFMNQGFAGLNTSIITSANSINHGLCDLGYKLQDCLKKFFKAIKNSFTKNAAGSLA